MRTPKTPPDLKFADTKLLAHMLEASDQENTQLRADLGRRIECEAAVVAERNALHAEIARLRAALVEYADPGNWLASTYDNTGELDGWWLWGDGPLAAGQEPWQIAQDALDGSH